MCELSIILSTKYNNGKFNITLNYCSAQLKKICTCNRKNYADFYDFGERKNDYKIIRQSLIY